MRRRGEQKSNSVGEHDYQQLVSKFCNLDGGVERAANLSRKLWERAEKCNKITDLPGEPVDANLVHEVIEALAGVQLMAGAW